MTKDDTAPASFGGLAAAPRGMEPLWGAKRTAVIGPVTGYVRGAARQPADIARVQKRTGVRDEQFRTGFAPLLDGHLDSGRHAALTALWRNAQPEWVDPFGPRSRRVLDGIEAMVESHRAGW